MPRPLHFEIHSEEPSRAIEFYTALFGWTFTRWEGPMDYWLVRTGEPPEPGIDGGLMRRMGGGPLEGAAVNAYVCTVGVGDIDATLAESERRGGRVALPKRPVPGVGWSAYIKDPDGNILGLLQPDADAR